MINQEIKTILTSWLICLNKLPLPKRILRDIEKGKSTKNQNYAIKKIILTDKQVSEIKEYIRPMIRHGDTAEEIYDRLIASGKIPQKGNSGYPSLAKIYEIVSELRKEMGLSRAGRDTGKLAFDMLQDGKSHQKISAILKIKESSIRTVASRHKKKLEKLNHQKKSEKRKPQSNQT